MQVSLYRYDPDKDVKAHMQHTSVDVPEGSDLMVLDVLEMLKAADPSLSFRRSCREGVCGSDGINMNGKNGLACITPLSEAAPKGKLELRPLPGLPVIRDLVVDMTQFYRQYEKVKPWLVNDEPPPAQERLQSPAEREKLDGLYECILCACCTTACPSFWWNPEKFVGPAGLLAGVSLPRGQPRHGDGRAPCESRGPVQRVPLPRHHELHDRLSAGPESDPRDRQDQGAARHRRNVATAGPGRRPGASGHPRNPVHLVAFPRA